MKKNLSARGLFLGAYPATVSSACCGIFHHKDEYIWVSQRTISVFPTELDSSCFDVMQTFFDYEAQGYCTVLCLPDMCVYHTAD